MATVADVPAWIGGWLAPGTVNRAQLDGRLTEALQRHGACLINTGGRPPVGLLEDLAGIVTGYAQVAACEALNTAPTARED